VAEVVQIGGGSAKLRKPWAVFLLVLVTLGGFLIVPLFVSEWRYYRRIGEAQAQAGMDHRISHVTGFVLYLIALILLPFETVYARHHLNRLWRHLVEEAQKAELGMRG
jgi:formate hydrogenlyase subunit 3/multisubunit Na+/H+ antiporter MnhD subunit